MNYSKKTSSVLLLFFVFGSCYSANGSNKSEEQKWLAEIIKPGIEISIPVDNAPTEILTEFFSFGLRHGMFTEDFVEELGRAVTDGKVLEPVAHAVMVELATPVVMYFFSQYFFALDREIINFNINSAEALTESCSTIALKKFETDEWKWIFDKRNFFSYVRTLALVTSQSFFEFCGADFIKLTNRPGKSLDWHDFRSAIAITSHSLQNHFEKEQTNFESIKSFEFEKLLDRAQGRFNVMMNPKANIVRKICDNARKYRFDDWLDIGNKLHAGKAKVL
ncbi:hypothetical protein HOD08_04130 [bacterium]|jgi:hypothetical protein|nr:hypothetical protein [bacterium]